MRRAARRINSARRNSWSTPRVSSGKEREHVLYLLTLPFRIFFGILLAVLLLPLGLLFLPFLLLRAVLKLAVVAVIAPFVLLAALAVVVATLAAIFLAALLPLLPFAALAAVLWLIVRPSSPRLTTGVRTLNP